MKLSDLKTGMIVTLRDGLEYVVFRNCKNLFHYDSSDILVNSKTCSWHNLSKYTDDLCCCTDKEWDIVKVEIPCHPYCNMNIDYEREKRKVFWERENVLEVTMAEIEEKFGCKVKIVKED